MTRLVGIDTNILVHALVVQDEEKHEKAKNLLREIVENGDRYLLSLQVVGELYATLLRVAPSLIPEAIELARLLAERLNLVHYTLTDLEEAAKTTTAPRRYWDTVLALTSRRHGARLMPTENTRDFNSLLPVHNPLAEE